jgi:pantoate--beta-alanine ligase
MVRQLAMPVDVVACPTVREPDGLARSSRNVYLDRDERARARVLYQALAAGQGAGDAGPEAVLDAATRVLVSEPALAVDYLVLTDPDMREAPRSGQARLLVAAQIGTTRLLDNAAVLLAAEDVP